MASKSIYSKLLLADRFDSETTNTTVEDSLNSDKSRVIFSSPFRRLQQKTQVFGLETNAGVRSRLTHTLEVASTGVSIAKKIADTLIKEKKLEPNLKTSFIEITETCCLLHDIGNPPFGHFGEAAIRKWFGLNWENSFLKAIGKSKIDETTNAKYDTLKNKLINDFIYFDGNPQGIRIILHLKNLPIEDYENGFNLTFSQILSCVKYIGNPNDVQGDPIQHKKPGYFHSESKKIDAIRKHLNWNTRFPITYIMEAADDISYCLSDIEDGIEKGIVNTETFFKELENFWVNPDLKKFELNSLYQVPKYKLSDYKSPKDFYFFKIRVTRNLTRIASSLFIKNEELIINGNCGDLLDYDEDAKALLDALKQFARKNLFRSKEAEYIELAGYKVIFGLLESYRDLLELSAESFNLLISAEHDTKILKGKDLDIQWRLFNMLPAKHKDAYCFEVRKLNEREIADFEQKEWYYRAHLLTDFISGMTDTFALETYRMLNGITIHNHG